MNSALPDNAFRLRETLDHDLMPRVASLPVQWRVLDGLSDYEATVAAMEAAVDAIAAGDEPEQIWLVEHPPLYTAGTSADDGDLVMPGRFPVHRTGRGGQYTYHGPGQRVAYIMLDLKQRQPDLRRFVSALEAWIIATLDQFQVRGERREDRVGVWVRRPDKAYAADGSMAEDKIAAIGIRVRRWVTFHGIAINVDPDLSHFTGIVPCGVSRHGVTSLVDLGLPLTMEDVDVALKASFEAIFGPVADAG